MNMHHPQQLHEQLLGMMHGMNALADASPQQGDASASGMNE